MPYLLSVHGKCVFVLEGFITHFAESLFVMVTKMSPHVSFTHEHFTALGARNISNIYNKH